MASVPVSSSPTGSRSKKFARGAFALLVVAVLAWGAWRSVPRAGPLIPAGDLDFARRFLRTTHSLLAPRDVAEGTELTSDAYRVSPGSSLYLGDLDFDGLLAARFQAVSPAGAVFEIVAEREESTSVILQRELYPALRQSDNQSFFLIVNSRAFPSGTKRIGLRTARTSPGAIDWRELHPLAEADLPWLRALPFPLVAFSGYQSPHAQGGDLHIHAPGELLLLAPAGPRTLEFVFGYDPAALARPTDFTDGANFTVRLEDAPSALLERHLAPMSRPGDRLPQSVAVTLDLPHPAILHFDVDPGANGNISFDWLIWGRFQTHPTTAAP